jgi:thiol-disulfide isomerase/thioredoxin
MYVRILTSLLILIVVTGCEQSTTQPILPAGAVSDGESAEVPQAADATQTSASPPEDRDQVNAAPHRFEKDGIVAEIATWEQTQKYIAKQVGKVVVLDAWSNSCPPCLKEFPHLVALQKKYPESVVCISFNLDYYGAEDLPPEAGSDKILAFLAKQKSELHNVISSTASDDFYDAVGGLASIPAIFVYTADGKLKKRFDNDQLEYGKDGFTYQQHVIPLIEKLLAERETEAK